MVLEWQESPDYRRGSRVKAKLTILEDDQLICGDAVLTKGDLGLVESEVRG